jgi:predicted ester cyclase
MAERLQKRIAELYFYKIWNQRDFRLTPYLFNDCCITRHICSLNGEEKKCDPEGINDYIKEWLAGFPNLKVKINKIVSDSNNISTYCTLSGMHQGEWRGIKPTGKFVIVEMMMIHKILNGKISENLIMTDYLGIYQQLGVLEQHTQFAIT